MKKKFVEDLKWLEEDEMLDITAIAQSSPYAGELLALAEEYPGDFARIIGLHTYSQSPRRAYDITLTGNWVERGGFRFEEFILTPRREDADHGRTE